MSSDPVAISRMLTGIVAVLALSLVLALVGLVVLGLAGGDPSVRDTLTHTIETVIGVFVGIAAGRLMSDD